jgi:carboxyl-terminal processing protease
MDTTVTEQNFTQKHTENYLKLTVGKLYRVNGTSAQFSGVQPDIVLPDMLDAYITKEANEPYALQPTVIATNKYYTPYAPLPVKALAKSVQTTIDTSKYFNAVKNFIAYTKQKKAATTVSLNVNDALANMNLADKYTDNTFMPVGSKKFTAQNSRYDTARLQADNNFHELNEEFSKQVSADPVINIAYDVLLKLKP